LHQRIKDDKAWNDAVQFSTKNEQGHVFVRENSTDNQLELFGYGAQKEELINLVIETIDEIHSTSKFGNLKVEKLVPCPCAVCVKKRANQEEGDFFEYELLIKDLQNGEMESDRCKLSRQRFPIKKILKNASIRLFKMEQIKELLEDDNVEDALNILKKVFPKEDEIILQLSRLSNLNYKDRTGQLTFDEANKERNRIIDAVLEMLKAREDDL
jgi:ribosomal protein L22